MYAKFAYTELQNLAKTDGLNERFSLCINYLVFGSTGVLNAVGKVNSGSGFLI